MAGSFTGSGYDLQPSAQQVPVESNYLGSADFDFLNQYLPDTYQKEFAKYGNRSVSSFMKLTSAELPSTSDMIKWTEEGRLHIKYTQVGTLAASGVDFATFQVNDTGVPAFTQTTNGIALRVGQTVVIIKNDGSGENKGVVTAVNIAATPSANLQFDVSFYEAGGFTGGSGVGNADCTVFIYGSEFQKGTAGMAGSLEADTNFLENSPIILKDSYEVSGSDMAQIGWVEVSTDAGAGFLWYLKSEGDTRMRFDDYLETSAIEAVPAENTVTVAAGYKGSDGVFYAVNNRGNLWTGGNPTSLSEFDTLVGRLDSEGAIEENAIFLDRQFGFDIDDMLATQNSYGAGGTSYGMFQNDEKMALNLGFSGFRRGYDFYKTDWKYLNDPTMRGQNVGGSGSGAINGLLVPAGTTNVYDQVMGANAKRPFLHVRYRASQTEDRRYKTWITGSAGGAKTNNIDTMEVNFLSERCTCTLGANNFVLFED